METVQRVKNVSEKFVRGSNREMEEEGAECTEGQVLSESSYGQLERRTDPGRGERIHDVNTNFYFATL